MVDDADGLYRLDPGEFVAQRDELAKRLRADKRRDEAAAVARLRRPTTTAWALNQVARDEPGLVAAALEAGERLRAATDAAVGGDASGLREATAADREATAAVVEAAARRLGDRGAAARGELAGTLRAAVLDDDVRDQLRRGVLTNEHEAPGFGLDLGLDVGPPPRPPKRASKPAPDAERERAEAEARRRRAELGAEVERLERRAARLAEVAERAEASARQARADADTAVEEAAAARRRLAELETEGGA